jgi:hypothetical protein
LKKLLIITSLLVCAIVFNTQAQSKYGNTFNVGIGVGGYGGYYKYAGKALPVITANYEFDVARNFTLAPFIGFYKYSNNYVYGNNQTAPRSYKYSETVIPVGLKGTYYLDEVFEANSKWDFYAASSLGFAVVNGRWSDNYAGDKKYFNKGNSLVVDIHLGAEYHVTQKLGIFLDLSTGISTIGVAFH